MLFSSIPFLYYFLPAVLILYFVLPKRLRNVILLMASLLFYAWGEPRYVILMITEILAGYLSGLLLAAFPQGRPAKLILALSLLVPVSLLIYFKYAAFLLENINAVAGLKLPLPQTALPIGISFYTFQIISYQIDVYRGNVKAQRNVLLLAVYVAMFPQLIAGPIVRYADIESQLARRTANWESAASGVRRFLIGMAKKILLANQLGELCILFRASAEPSVLFAWLYAAAFTLQIYFDFSGYSDMAIGLGRIFGFHFPENFRYPYIAGSITEFWRRWHISLGSWFRDYVYIPLGGNRGSALSRLRNIALVWMLTGIWHGAAWNFVIWGLYFAVLLIAEKWLLLPVLEKQPLLRHIYVLFLVMISFVIFNAASMQEALTDLGRMFGAGGIALSSEEFWYYLRSYAVTLAAAVLAATPLPGRLIAKIRLGKTGRRLTDLAEPLLPVLILLVITAYLVDGSFNPFLYFRF